jgi:uncharacterized protein YbjT (DUF2867 family)
MHALVVGASGRTGRELVQLGLERGHKVTAFVRNPARFELAHERLVVVRGDVLDAASLRRAVQGQDGVLCALGHKRWFPPNRILSQGTRNIVEAMQAHGVRRLVCQTSLGVGDSFGRMGLYYTLFVVPFILPFYYWDKQRQEQVVRASGLDWVIVRPGALTQGRPRGRWRHGSHVGSFLWTVRIARADTAAFMLEQLYDDTYLERAVGVAW